MTPKSETPTSITDGPTRAINMTDEVSTGTTAPAGAKQTVATPTGEAVPMAIMKVVGVAEIEGLFSYHKPESAQVAKIEAIRAQAKEFGTYIVRNIAPCRERGLAVTKLEEAVMWANAAIVRGEK